MKHALLLLGLNLPASVCAGGAIYLASNNLSPWVWGPFLFVAFCLATTELRTSD